MDSHNRASSAARGSSPRRSWVLLAALLGMALPATGSADREPEPLRKNEKEARPAPDRERESNRAFKTEEQIQRMVEDALAADQRISSTAIIPFVEGHRVSLEGTVQSRAEQRAAGEIARQVNGVEGVSNRLRVRPGSGSSATRLAARVRRALENDDRLGDHDIRAQVVNRTVQLAGSVGTAEQARRAVRLVRRLRGVARVDNAMVLRPTETGARSNR